VELDQFDALVRQLSQNGASRRRAMRVLTGGLLGGTLAGIAARLGLAEIAAARPKSKHKRKPHGALQTAGKRRKKHRKQRSQPQLPPSTATPTPTPTPGLCPSDCTGRGGRCCADGSCLAIDQCCPDAPPPVCGACDVQACDHGVMVCVSLEVPCVGDLDFNPQTCRCECPSGSDLLDDGLTCCPHAKACYFNDGRPTGCCTGGDTCVEGNLCT
jgi:hypothetical protein